MSERKMVTLRIVSEIKSIPGADAIDVAVVDGWETVVKKGEFSRGDFGVFFEIDCFLPEADARFAFLMKHTKKFNGIPGVRLKTIRLREQLSQGLLLPIKEFPDIIQTLEEEELIYGSADTPIFGHDPEIFELDFAEKLGVQKYEKAIAANLVGKVKGNFPHFLFKTDQERIQNYWGKVSNRTDTYEVTEKLDGSSMTVYINDGVFGVCSRNLELLPTDGNPWWTVAKRENLEEKMTAAGGNYAIQGELIGPGMNGNHYGLTDYSFAVFDVFDIDSRSYLAMDERRQYLEDLGYEMHVPGVTLRTADFASVAEILEYAEGKSQLNPQKEREGLVWKSLSDPDFSFKTISNKFLLGEKD